MEMLEDHEVALSPGRIAIIKTESEHLRWLVSDLTTLSQVDSSGLDIQLSAVKPCDLLSLVYQAFQPIAAIQAVVLVLDCTPESPEIMMENALRSTPQGGRITLCGQMTGRVELHVTDSGSGIDPENLPFIFERSYHGKKSRESKSGKMGLGKGKDMVIRLTTRSH